MIALDAGETIKKVIRGGSTRFLLEVLFIAIVALLPWGLYQVNALESILSSDHANVKYLLLFFYGIWLLFCWIFIFAAWMEYYLGTWIITDARVMSAHSIGFLKRQLIAIRFDKIKEVNLGLKGSVKLVLNNDEGMIVIPKAKHPQAIKDLIIFEQKKAYERLKEVISIDEVEMGMVE